MVTHLLQLQSQFPHHVLCPRYADCAFDARRLMSIDHQLSVHYYPALFAIQYFFLLFFRLFMQIHLLSFTVGRVVFHIFFSSKFTLLVSADEKLKKFFCWNFNFAFNFLKIFLLHFYSKFRYLLVLYKKCDLKTEEWFSKFLKFSNSHFTSTWLSSSRKFVRYPRGLQTSNGRLDFGPGRRLRNSIENLYRKSRQGSVLKKKFFLFHIEVQICK